MKDLYIPPLLVITDYEEEQSSASAISGHDNAYTDYGDMP